MGAESPDVGEFVQRSLVDAFVDQVERSADASAVLTADASLTYADLAKVAFGISHAIAERLAHNQGPVMLFLGQGPSAIAASLGALASGGLYVPLDPTGPRDFIRSVVSRVKPSVVVTEAASMHHTA